MSLPLPLAPFEDYMFFDDRPTHPMCFFIRLKLSGNCDAAALDVALRRALSRHPLLCAKAEKSGRISSTWQPLASEQASVRWESNSSADDELASHLDIRSRSGLEVIGTRTDGGLELLFQFHHSCCDGIGGLGFIEDVLLEYDQEVHGSAAASSSPAAAECQLKQRAKLGLNGWKFMQIAHRQAIGLIGAWQCMMRVPASLTTVETEDFSTALPRRYPTSVSHEFTKLETQHLLEAARAEKTKLNNLLASKLFVAIQQFRKELGNEDSRRWVRISIPIDLRRPGADGQSAANYVSMVFLDRRPEDTVDEKSLLASIHQQMNRIKDFDLGLTLPLMLRLVKPLGIIASLEGDEQCRCTVVLSNLMRPLSDSRLSRSEGITLSGKLKLNGIDFMPPVRPKTNAAFGVLTYADRLSITQHYDSRVMSDGEARRLLELYVEGLLSIDR